MKYIKLVIEIADKQQESIISELFDMNFDGFEQREGRIICYVSEENFGVGVRQDIEELLKAYPGEGQIKEEEVIADQNWNEQWEQTIEAKAIGRFFVKPTWSTTETPDDKILLEIDPKMSFGTGYHETTRLMLRALPEIVEEGDTVIDAGTGSGILSIAAVKLGAEGAFAFDIDEWSISNTKENIQLNEVEQNITVKKGSAEVIPRGAKADVVLANIEKNTIMALLDDLKNVLKGGGQLLLSGLLESDRESVITALGNEFKVNEILQENEWIAIHAEKKVS